MMDREQMENWDKDGDQIRRLAADNADRAPTAIIERCSTGTFIDALRRLGEAQGRGSE
jgi:hypothetical protein